MAIDYRNYTDSAFDDLYDAFDNEIDYEGDVDIFGIAFSKSRILKELDPIAYAVYFDDYLDSQGIDPDNLSDDE